MKQFVVSTERLLLREWEDGDLSALIAMNCDPDVMKYFPKSLNETESIAMADRIAEHFKKNGFGLYVVEQKTTNQFLGFTGFSIPTFEASFTPCVEIGWRFQKKAWGQGFATEAATACLQFGFDHLKFDQIYSFTAAVNVKSEKLMNRIAMSYVSEFEHPLIEKSSNLCKHVLYQAARKNYSTHRQ